jgi:hypothetical protein
MTSGAQTREGQFVEVSWGFPSILIGSRLFLALRWMTLEKVLGVGAMRHWLYLAAKALGVGPTRHSLVSSLHWVVAYFLGDVKPPGFDICGGVDWPSTCSLGTGSPGAWLSET